MPGLTAKYLRSAPKKSPSSAAHVGGEEDDVRSVSSSGSVDNDVAGQSPAITVSERGDASVASRAMLRSGLVGRASWREARKFMEHRTGVR